MSPLQVVATEKVPSLQVVAPNTALRLKCLQNFTNEEGKYQQVGQKFLFKGPGTYIPRIEVQVVEIVRAVFILPNQALKLRALKKTVDCNGNKRRIGEEWLIKTVRSYLPSVDEEVVETINAHILTDKRALHLRATRTFCDVFGVKRKAGKEWLITFEQAKTYIPDVYEQVVREVEVTILTNRQYCVVLDPWKKGKQLLGQKELRKGEVSFFLQPGEKLETGIQSISILANNEALLLKSCKAFTDETRVKRAVGECWMIQGPCDYVPSIEVEIVEKRKTIPFNKNEVRDLKTGQVVKIGHSCIFNPNEELKDFPPIVEELLTKERNPVNQGEERDPWTSQGKITKREQVV